MATIRDETALRRHGLHLGVALALCGSTAPIFGQVLEEIVVTAQKREEGLQDTPIAVTAFTASALDDKGIDNIAEVADFTPNLVFDTTSPVSGLSSGAVIFIRGIGNTDFSLTTDPGVGTYVDGVYMSRSAGGVLDVLDVERIEVLRGPQGTLFGRNTIGGAVSITSRKPADTYGGSVDVTLGNFGRRDVRATADLPLSDTVRASLALSQKKRDGYVRRVLVGDELGDEDKLSFRGTLVVEPNDRFDLQFSYDYTKIDEQSAGSTIVGFTPGASTVGYALFRAAFAPDAPGLDQFVTNGEDDISFATGPTGTELSIDGISFIASLHGESWDLKYTGARRETDGFFNRDPDNSPVAITHTLNSNYLHEQTSHELQLTGDVGTRFRYVAGLYDFTEEGNDDVFVPIFLPNVDDPNNLFGFPAAVNNFAEVDNGSEAIYAQGTYDVTDSLSLTAGIRRTEDDKTFIYTQYIAADIEGNPLPVPLAAVDENGDLVTGLIPLVGNGSGRNRADFEETSIRLGADYRFSDDTLGYYSYSEGFKSGGFVLRYVEARPEPLTFEPEFVEAHEFGLKWQGWDDRLRINSAVFFMDYEDAQVTFFDTLGGPITANAGSVDIKGVEFELTGLVTERLSVEVGLGYTDAEYDSITPISGLSLTIDESASLVNTPALSLNLGAEYAFDLAGGHELAARLDYAYTDDVHNDSQNSPFLFQESYDVWNARLRFESASRVWSATLFVDNLTDERFIVSGDSNFGLGFHEANYNRPREYGVRISANF